MKIRVIVIRPGKAPTVEEIADSIEALQALVGGYVELVHVPTAAGYVDMYFNEDGKRDRLPPNRYVAPLDDIVLGTIVVASARVTPDGGMVSFGDDEIARLLPVVSAWGFAASGASLPGRDRR